MPLAIQKKSDRFDNIFLIVKTMHSKKKSWKMKCHPTLTWKSTSDFFLILFLSCNKITKIVSDTNVILVYFYSNFFFFNKQIFGNGMQWGLMKFLGIYITVKVIHHT